MQKAEIERDRERDREKAAECGRAAFVIGAECSRGGRGGEEGGGGRRPVKARHTIGPFYSPLLFMFSHRQ